ncbi:hypothetical protein [Aureimonas populi]|nr:hypothetical protein [Aureimonas populi]
MDEESSWDQRHDDREYVPELSALNGTDQEWRLPRLARVYGTARQLFLTVEHRPLPATIVHSLHDERGTLIVKVSSPQWQAFLEPFFHLAWRSENENPEQVRVLGS